MLHRVLELAGLTIRLLGPLLIGLMSPKSKLRYLEAMPELLIGVAQSVNIKFVIRGPVGGLSSRSLLWFLPRFPAPILVRFFFWPPSVLCGGYLLGLPCIARAGVFNPR